MKLANKFEHLIAASEEAYYVYWLDDGGAYEWAKISQGYPIINYYPVHPIGRFEFDPLDEKSEAKAFRLAREKALEWNAQFKEEIEWEEERFGGNDDFE